jgi:hypothetical protein
LARELAANFTLLPSAKNKTAGALAVDTSCPTVKGIEVIPETVTARPSTQNGSSLVTVAMGVNARPTKLVKTKRLARNTQFDLFLIRLSNTH